ncbi:cysteine hydrolase family protein [Pantoea cypripedii]|uniref:Cysteine hydrolase n=1 Tax=Pantoea cypripedii TaxID=55209 RepID=A0A6B9G9C0_PANCY|nr:isochorismatase family cysteine hydrolase [Pantoea cypripedii]QGY32453.1 cysteine hydrolase [Pantoea cypripedii]
MSHYTLPDYRRSALITIDTQRDTLDGQPLEIPGTSAALPNIVKLAQAWREAGLPVVHIVRIYQRNGSNVDLCRREAVEGGAEILLEGSEGCELAEDLLPQRDIRFDTETLLGGGIQHIGPDEIIIYKPRWGAFFQTPLQQWLTDQQIDTLVFAGCNYPNCPRTSIYQASERDFRVVLAQDALSGLYEQGQRELQGIGVHLLQAETIVEALKKASSAP